MVGGEFAADLAQVVAGIEAFGDGADVLAQRLAVTQVHRARQDIDLGAGIVDVIFARDGIAGEGQQIGERVAEDRAAAVPDMHRPGRIGRDVFDIDLLALTRVAAAVILPRRQHDAQLLAPDMRLERKVDEAGSGDVHFGDEIVGAEPLWRSSRPDRAASGRHPWRAPWRHWSPYRHGSDRAAARPRCGRGRRSRQAAARLPHARGRAWWRRGVGPDPRRR